MRIPNRPLTSLQAGYWFKLICGASYQHLPSIRNLALAYALAGADCIDVAADPAVVAAVKDAFSLISRLHQLSDYSSRLPFSLPAELPLLMVSFSDGEDPHFRKATFDPQRCPTDCVRPCEVICPAAAISFDEPAGVIAERCYGCGRCLPVCPIQQIETLTRSTPISAIAPELLSQVDAIEIHTHVGRYDDFMVLWSELQPYLSQLQLVAISCPDHDSVIEYLWQLYDGIQPTSMPLIWQTDGRPMSGDIGKGTTHATLRYGQKVLQSGPPGFVQLAGGTNAHTVTKVESLRRYRDRHNVVPPSMVDGLLSPYPYPTFGGIAYGSFARQLLNVWLENLPPWPSQFASAPKPSAEPFTHALETSETFLHQLTPGVQLAQSLVTPLKAAYPTPAKPSVYSVDPSPRSTVVTS